MRSRVDLRDSRNPLHAYRTTGFLAVTGNASPNADHEKARDGFDALSRSSPQLNREMNSCLWLWLRLHREEKGRNLGFNLATPDLAISGPPVGCIMQPLNLHCPSTTHENAPLAQLTSITSIRLSTVYNCLKMHWWAIESALPRRQG